jgi:maltose alpha-D-glucosyltransferase / alpha-amylase
VALDLSAFRGRVPVELFGHTAFPVINHKPFFLTLAPYAFYWFALEPQRRGPARSSAATLQAQIPVLTVADRWEGVFLSPSKAPLEVVLAAYLPTCCWFGGRQRPIGAVRIQEAVALPHTAPPVYLTFLHVEYLRGDPETYALPVAGAAGEQATRILEQAPPGVIARVQGDDHCEILYDALYDPGFCTALLQGLIGASALDTSEGIRAWTTEEYAHLQDTEDSSLEPALLQTERSNTLIAYGNRLILKLFRRLEAGVNPDLEVGHFLTRYSHFVHSPPVLGALEYYRRGRPDTRITLGVLQGYVPHQEDAWHYTLAALGTYFDRVLATQAEVEEVALAAPALLDRAQRTMPPLARQLVGPYQQFARLLGRRTAELHLALASESEAADFAPEPFSFLSQRSLYQSMRSLTVRVYWRLSEALPRLPEAVRAEAQGLLARQEEVLQRFQAVLGRPITGLRLRCHGDYHLRQVLCTGKDVALIDFEGEPARLLGERQLKRSPLLDVAGMLLSLHYAAYTTFFDRVALQETAAGADPTLLESWTRFWCGWVSATFLKTYLRQTAGMAFLPQTDEELRILCDIHLLEKAIYELGYELEHRPDMVRLPLRGLLQLLGPPR